MLKLTQGLHAGAAVKVYQVELDSGS